jgi:hypothetical protein
MFLSLFFTSFFMRMVSGKSSFFWVRNKQCMFFDWNSYFAHFDNALSHPQHSFILLLMLVCVILHEVIHIKEKNFFSWLFLLIVDFFTFFHPQSHVRGFAPESCGYCSCSNYQTDGIRSGVPATTTHTTYCFEDVYICVYVSLQYCYLCLYGHT